MTEARAAAVSQPGVNIDSELRNRLHELSRGDYSEAEFVGEISSLVRAAPDSAGNALVAINQQFIRGEISADDFRAKASKIIGRGTAPTPYAATLDLRTRPAEQTADSRDDSSPFAGVEIGRVLRDRYEIGRASRR